MNADTQVLPPSMATEAEMSDLLVARAQRGDSQAFVELIDVYDRRLRTLAYDLLGDGQLVDDVLQDAYLHAFRGLKHFRRASSLGTWLYRITYNACHDALRRQRRAVPLADAQPLDLADPAAIPPSSSRRKSDCSPCCAGYRSSNAPPSCWSTPTSSASDARPRSSPFR